MYNFLFRKNVKVINKIDDDFNILVMGNMSRKMKFLIALNKNALIISSDWLTRSFKKD